MLPQSYELKRGGWFMVLGLDGYKRYESLEVTFNSSAVIQHIRICSAALCLWKCKQAKNQGCIAIQYHKPKSNCTLLNGTKDNITMMKNAHFE